MLLSTLKISQKFNLVKEQCEKNQFISKSSKVFLILTVYTIKQAILKKLQLLLYSSSKCPLSVPQNALLFPELHFCFLELPFIVSFCFPEVPSYLSKIAYCFPELSFGFPKVPPFYLLSASLPRMLFSNSLYLLFLLRDA